MYVSSAANMKPKSQEKEGANNMHLTELARKTDISCVQAFHTRDEIDAMIEAAIHCRFAAAFTLPAFSSYVAEKLAPYPAWISG